MSLFLGRKFFFKKELLDVDAPTGRWDACVMVISSLDMVNWLLIAFSLVIFGVASWYDIRTREVPDLLWVIYLIGGLPLSLVKIVWWWIDGKTSLLLSYAISVVLGLSVAIMLGLLGMWGGADVKGFMVLSLMALSSVKVYKEPYVLTIVEALLPWSIHVLMNSYIILFPLPLVLFFYNMMNRVLRPAAYKRDSDFFWNEPRYKRMASFFIGYPTKVETLVQRNPWKYDFLENYIEGKWKFNFTVGLGEVEEDLKRRQELLGHALKTNREYVWVQPSIPFIFALWCGTIISIFLGNIVLLLFYVIFV